MKKKIIALTLALAMCLGMGTTALAAPSPVVPGPVTPTTSTLEKGNLTSAEYGKLSEVFGDWYTADGKFDTSQGETDLDLIVKRNERALQIVEEYAGVNGFERADVVTAMNLSVDDITAEEWSKGVDIALMEVPALKYDKYVVLHITSDGKIENIPVKVVGGRIIGTFHSLSPVIVIGLKGNFSPVTVSTTVTATNSSGAAIELKVTGNALAGANAEETKVYNMLFRTWQKENGEKELAELWDQLKAGKITESKYKEKQSEIFTKYLAETISSFSRVRFTRINWYNEVNISLPDGVAMPEGGLDITIHDSQIKKSSTMILLHIKSNGTIEEIRNLKVADGSITGHVDSLSPFIYMDVDPVAGAVNASAPYGSGTNLAQPSASPKTGEQGNAAPFCLAGMMVVCGAVYFGRKRFHA